MTDIVINDLTKSYNGNPVIEHFSITVKAGERIAFMAPSGYGKTTLLKLILGLIEPDSGQISGVPENVSVVFQEDRLSENFSVKTNIRFTKSKNFPASEIDKVLKSLKLVDFASKPVKDLSGGMKRRVAIARSLCADFDLLVLDEPFEGLDDALKYEIIAFLSEYSKGKTIIMVTHNIDEAKALDCRIVKLDEYSM